jgi:hypothetical protein
MGFAADAGRWVNVSKDQEKIKRERERKRWNQWYIK